MRAVLKMGLSAVLVGGLLAACSGAGGGSDSLDPTDTGGGIDLDGAPDGLADTLTLDCKPACVAPQKCSVLNKCIDADSCAADGDCKAGMKCITPEAGKPACLPGGDCGAESASADKVPSNVLIVLDRSCSMTAKVGALTKWQIAVQAISDMTTKYKGKLRFGLIMFPDTDADKCNQGTIPIPLGPDNETKISTMLSSALKTTDPFFPDGPCVTNIDTAMKQAATDPGLGDATRQSYVLLLTDGAQAGCTAGGGDAGTLAAITDLATKRGVKTFVVGFGSGVDTAAMDSFAAAGGVPAAAASPKFFKAEDATSLDKALTTIGSTALGCVFKLGKAPPDSTKIFAFFDKSTEVPRDTTKTNGWDYDPTTNTVTFYGSFCADIKAEKVKAVDVVFGCNKPPA